MKNIRAVIIVLACSCHQAGCLAGRMRQTSDGPSEESGSGWDKAEVDMGNDTFAQFYPPKLLAV
ncbi:MAG: hypothetical protein ACLTBV_20545 [Enterocloster bolteae]